MGAQQSSSKNSNTSESAATKTCYYEVLGVDRHATEDEIKKAYRRKALELHPDRNYGAVEAATTAFAEVSSAYEVLSDPQERAWYDSHRESILRGDSGGVEEAEHNVQLTSAAALTGLMGRFSSRTQFTDTSTGFYGILNETFSQLAKEEDAACEWDGLEIIDYPEFGTSKDNYEDGVRDFYKVWASFSTKKSFSWRDGYRASDAPDRQTRRLIEKENKRLRDEGIREFNDSVRSLVAFIRKRDPRYTPNTQSFEDRQKILRDASAAHAARTRAANKAKLDLHIVPEWAQTEKTDEREGSFSSEEEEVIQQIECVVCDKVFKSEKQYEAHEKSKKHAKAVQQLRRQMQLENRDLELDTLETTAQVGTLRLDDDQDANHPLADIDDFGRANPETRLLATDDNIELINHSTLGTGTALEAEKTLAGQSSDIESEYGDRSDVEKRFTQAFKEDSSSIENANGGIAIKLGKAKAKRARKLARQETTTNEMQKFACAVCKERFDSRTKLFSHIKQVGHAQPGLQHSNKAKKRAK